MLGAKWCMGVNGSEMGVNEGQMGALFFIKCLILLHFSSFNSVLSKKWEFLRVKIHVVAICALYI